MKDKLSQVARSIGQSANGMHHLILPLSFTQFIAEFCSKLVASIRYRIGCFSMIRIFVHHVSIYYKVAFIFSMSFPLSQLDSSKLCNKSRLCATEEAGDYSVF